MIFEVKQIDWQEGVKFGGEVLFFSLIALHQIVEMVDVLSQ